MTESVVKDEICKECGAEIRTGSLFCYNCGKAVSTNGATGHVEENANNQPSESLVANEPAAEKKIDAKRKPLKSAASLRRQQRAYNRQPVEVTWVRPEGLPKTFVFATVILTLAALVLLIIALYLR